MKCPKCNSIINESENFCILCGYSFDQQPINQNQPINQQTQQNNSLQTENINNSNVISNNTIQSNNSVNIQNNVQQEEQAKPQTTNNNYLQNKIIDDYYKENMLYDAYIGKGIDRLKNGGFSWCTFFFGWFYTLYRKMWVFSIIYWIITTIISNFFKSDSIQLIIGLIIAICAGWMFKGNYLSHVDRKVREIKEKNSDKTHEELMKICKKKGGTSFLSIILLFGIIIITSIITAYINVIPIKDIIDKLKNNEIKVSVKVKRQKISFNLPDGFKEKYNNELLYTTTYEEKSSNSNCELTLVVMKSDGKTTAIEAMENYRDINKSSSPIEEKKINGDTWVYMALDNTHNYKIVYDNLIYDWDFKINSEDDQKKCSKFYSAIVNSMRLD